MVTDLEITVSRSNGSVELVISGDIDLAASDRFNQALTDAIYEARHAVNLDLSGVTFMGSTLISSLVHARRLAIEEGVALRIVKASTNVERLLERMALTDHFR